MLRSVRHICARKSPAWTVLPCWSTEAVPEMRRRVRCPPRGTRSPREKAEATGA